MSFTHSHFHSLFHALLLWGALSPVFACTRPERPAQSVPPTVRGPQERFATARKLYRLQPGGQGLKTMIQLCAEGRKPQCDAALALVKSDPHRLRLLHRACVALGPVYCNRLAMAHAAGAPLESGFSAELTRLNTPDSALSRALIAYAGGNTEGAMAALEPLCADGGRGNPCSFLALLKAIHPASLKDLRALTHQRICRLLPASRCGLLVEPLKTFQGSLDRFAAACTNKDPEACVALGDTLSYVLPGVAPFGTGPHLPADLAPVLKAHLEEQLGPLPVPTAAPATPGAHHYARACALKSPRGCFGAWYLAAVSGHAQESWRKAWFSVTESTCSPDRMDQCFPGKVARVAEKDLDADAELLIFKDLSLRILRGARREDAKAFDTLARWHPFIYCGKNRYASVRKLLKEGCEAGSVSSCVQYGELLEVVGFFHKAQIGTRESRRKSRRRLRLAAWAYNRSCRRGAFWSCYPLSVLYLNGFGVKKNLARSQKLLERARQGLKRQCEASSADACFNLARIPSETSRAELEDLHRRACTKGHLGACLRLSSQGKGARAKTLLKLTDTLAQLRCRTGDTKACVAAGALELLTAGLPGGATKASPWFLRGCRMHDPASCWMASFVEELSADSIATLRAAHFLQRKACLLNTSLPCEGLLPLKRRVLIALSAEDSCRDHSDASCAKVGAMLQVKGFRGYKSRFKELWGQLFPGVHAPSFTFRQHKRSARAIFKLLNTACSAGSSEACMTAHSLTEKHPGLQGAKAVKVLEGRVAELLKKECAAQKPGPCRSMALYCMQKKMGCQSLKAASGYWEKAFAIYRTRCGRKRPMDCYHAAQILDQSDPEAKNIEQVVTYMDKACWWSVKPACTYLGLYWFTRDPTEKAGKYLAKACRLGDAEACYRAGRFYERRGSASDVTKARRFYARACAKKLRIACSALGQL